MPRGRKPKPVEQRIREGNPGNRPLPEPLQLDNRTPRKPAGLPPAAAELWDEIVPVLEQAKVLHSIDRAALQAMCIEWSRYLDANADVEEESPYALGSMGQVVEHPAVGTARTSAHMFLRFAEQFGLTPSARARISAMAQVAQGLDLEAILDAKPEPLPLGGERPDPEDG
ncbi:MAG TPA: phage terminase small subunit P27 family [Gaiellaceae bacterium]|nr:phage terminase small subunit P27 family [Gaiellaceae bacterium]